MTTIKNGLMTATITVPVNERALVLKDGRIVNILRPGRHIIRKGSSGLEVDAHNLLRPEFVSVYDHVLFRDHEDLARQHLTEVRTGPNEVAIIMRDGRAYDVVPNDGRVVYFTDAGPFTIERFDTSEVLEVPAHLVRNAALLQVAQRLIKRLVVDEGHVGLLSIDHKFVRLLEPGVHAFFDVGREIGLRTVETRRRTLDVSGQEMLTRDRVTIRVNLAADYRVADPVKAVAEVRDFEDALYRALQFAFRKSLGTKTLDEILANKVTVDVEAAQAVRAEMSAIGIEVGEIALKDVILPGEMRDIVNQVVQAEKKAQANVIRRREETAATRSLLNTAKVMAENPVMLRLKELEALETVAGKVQYLAVHNGTQGLLEDLVHLRETPKA
jgi:regulator of protease activity HflC (stomatin/prohibitin superfamily)